MEKKIKVIIKKPGCKPYGTTIDPSEESIQKKLGGEYRRFRQFEDGCIICRRDVAGLEYNCEYCGRDFYGTMIFCGWSETEFTSYPLEFRVFKKLNSALFKDFEEGDEAMYKDIGKLLGFVTLIGAWAWIGFELASQIIKLI